LTTRKERQLENLVDPLAVARGTDTTLCFAFTFMESYDATRRTEQIDLN